MDPLSLLPHFVAQPTVVADDAVFRAVAARDADPFLGQSFEDHGVRRGGAPADEQPAARRRPQQLLNHHHHGIEVVARAVDRVTAFAGNDPIRAEGMAAFRLAMEHEGAVVIAIEAHGAGRLGGFRPGPRTAVAGGVFEAEVLGTPDGVFPGLPSYPCIDLPRGRQPNGLGTGGEGEVRQIRG